MDFFLLHGVRDHLNKYRNKVSRMVEKQNPPRSAFLGSAKILEKPSQVGSEG